MVFRLVENPKGEGYVRERLGKDGNWHPHYKPYDQEGAVSLYIRGHHPEDSHEPVQLTESSAELKPLAIEKLRQRKTKLDILIERIAADTIAAQPQETNSTD